MFKTRMRNLGAALWARIQWAAKAIVAAAAPIVVDALLQGLELVEGEARLWIAALVGGVAVFTTPNDYMAPARAARDRLRR
jgi:hypothetical protein